MVTILLLVARNLFLTFAWYGHLKLESWPLWQTVLASWGIAFFEYCLLVPANRWGHGRFCASQLKKMQEMITVVVFMAFAFLAWFKKGSGTVMRSTLRAVPATVPDPFLNHAAFLYLGESPRWNYLVAYGLIVIAVGVAFLPGHVPPPDPVHKPPPLQQRAEPS